jgi:molecular chaperone DnaK (HSP70)
MRLDLDGILEVAAVEKRTGKSKHITIANALHAKSPEEIAAGRKRIQELYEGNTEEPDHAWEPQDAAPAVSLPSASDGEAEVRDLMERSRRLLDSMHAEDREEAIDLHEKIGAALESGDSAALGEASRALKELLFFVEL